MGQPKEFSEDFVLTFGDERCIVEQTLMLSPDRFSVESQLVAILLEFLVEPVADLPVDPTLHCAAEW